MSNIINKMLLFFKVLLLIISFALTLYIMLYMYYNLEKEPFGKDFGSFVEIIIPFVLLLIFYVINLVARQKSVNNNLFYNLTCVIVTIAILYIGYRALTDQNMLLWHKTNFRINFEYFADQVFQIKAMLYGLVGANIFFILEGMLSREKDKKVISD